MLVQPCCPCAISVTHTSSWAGSMGSGKSHLEQGKEPVPSTQTRQTAEGLSCHVLGYEACVREWKRLVVSLSARSGIVS